MLLRDVLIRGGTAVDAAIAALVCNGAVHCQSMGLGGGFVMNIYKRDEQKAYFLDARETVPSKATQNMFVNNNHDKGPLSGESTKTAEKLLVFFV